MTHAANMALVEHGPEEAAKLPPPANPVVSLYVQQVRASPHNYPAAMLSVPCLYQLATGDPSSTCAMPTYRRKRLCPGAPH